MKVSRSGYYKWIKRKNKDNRYKEKRELLKEKIIKINNKHQTYGYRNIAQNIRNKENIEFSDWLCHKCCKELKIKSKARKHYNKPGTEHETYPNLIGKDFTANRAFQKVCTDTTIFKHKGIRYDFNIYLDLFNNEIIAYDLRLSKLGSGTKNHFKALKRFLLEKEKRGYKDLETILHSDQGTIYASRAFNSQLDYTIKRSMSKIATPTDNAVLESINGWIKDELRIDFNMNKVDDIHQLISQYVIYYNNDRLAYSLKYKSPVQYRTELNYI